MQTKKTYSTRIFVSLVAVPFVLGLLVLKVSKIKVNSEGIDASALQPWLKSKAIEETCGSAYGSGREHVPLVPQKSKPQRDVAVVSPFCTITMAFPVHFVPARVGEEENLFNVDVSSTLLRPSSKGAGARTRPGPRAPHWPSTRQSTRRWPKGMAEPLRTGYVALDDALGNVEGRAWACRVRRVGCVYPRPNGCAASAGRRVKLALCDAWWAVLPPRSLRISLWRPHQVHKSRSALICQ